MDLIAFDLLLDERALLRDRRAMPSFAEFEQAAPELAARVRERFTAAKHHTLATLRRDGSPRISGTECRFADGQLTIGSMWQARKALDLRRDPRFALHSASSDPPEWRGDAKVAGVAVELEPGPHEGRPSHAFRLDLREASHVAVDEERKLLVIEVWTPDRGVRRIERV